ncbi:transposase [Candidatus Vecturithrix granuli]|uniref:Transposase n=1 Tax=Vecturithrix granuli TaxID=1499967 RepID=A0A081BW54_VECG1|nr:transposase [Candidatus Vecturithrix granuli]
MMDVLHDILGIPQVTIERVELQETEIHLSVKPWAESAICPLCHRASRELHQHNSVRVIRDLPLSGKPGYLHLSRRRFWCPQCSLPFNEPLDFVEPYRNSTRRYESHIYELVRQNNIRYVEVLEGLSYEIVERIFLREATRRIPAEPFKGLRKLGLDEIAERKGRKAYDVIFYNLETGKPVEVLQGRTKQQLLEYLKALAEEVKASIEEVCIDMWRPYAQVVFEVLPHAVLVADRFHVMRSVNTDLKDLKHSRKKDVPEKAKACHYPLLKNQEDLTEQQQETLDAVYEVDPGLKRAHQLKEEFRTIFETIQTVENARKQVQRWISNAYKHHLVPTVITTMKTWLSAILNYFHHRTTNSPSEGINNKIKLVKRRGDGFRNFDNFRLRILTAF